MANDVTSVCVSMPLDLRERARRVAKRIRSNSAQLIRDGLIERIEFWEAKFRAEDERKKLEKIEKNQRSLGRMGRMGEKPLYAGPLSPSARNAKAPDDADDEPQLDPYLAKICEREALRIFEVLESDPIEKRLRIDEAVKRIKSEMPLTHPSDKEILAALEHCVLRLRESAPPPSILDAPPAPIPEPPPSIARRLDGLVGKILNPQRVRSLGDVDGE